jgi:hypothetical protein
MYEKGRASCGFVQSTLLCARTTLGGVNTLNAPSQPLSLWHDDPSLTRFSSAPLTGDISADVAIVGAGYTGLWTAYFLLKENPSLTVVICEAEEVGSA